MNREKRIRIGVIADDFTGASDAASFLVKSGAKTIMFNEVPEGIEFDCDAVVIALKTRSVKPDDAISQTKKAIKFLKEINCEKIYFKYCSTFDSTPKGNIGIIGDYLMEYLNVPYTLLCPSLPINGRIVKDGILYVNGVKLDESPLKNHPLNPMWDSYIPNLMKDQSKYNCYTISQDELNNRFDFIINELSNINEHFYLVPDYKNDEDGYNIGLKFNNLKFITGGSGLLEFILDRSELKQEMKLSKNTVEKAVILCGSCSKATKNQVHEYVRFGGTTFAIDANELIDGNLKYKDILDFILNSNDTVLVYSDAIDKDMSEIRKTTNFKLASKLLEEVFAKLSKELVKEGYNRIIVGGGETSGAITKELNFDGFYIGESIDPGVPELYPLKNDEITLILKSGNFGSDDFFIKAARGK